MELVVEFWPNHYMALYHAGAAAYERGEYERAEEYLLAFLEALTDFRAVMHLRDDVPNTVPSGLPVGD